MLQNVNHIRTCVEPSCTMVPKRVQRDGFFFVSSDAFGRFNVVLLVTMFLMRWVWVEARPGGTCLVPVTNTASVCQLMSGRYVNI